ncbi:MAG: T9SS C-terminal target domain-containing protein [Candidatus Dadabacteria bacterium]|nr:MAG: T9SS C-terminal target domain-containing protein [Candidatus Dadabacteria bacterium]
MDVGREGEGADVVIYGARWSDRLGFEVETPDLDGDGMADLVVSSFRGWGENDQQVIGGVVYVLYGRRDWKRSYDMDVGEFDFALEGPRQAGLGYRVSLGDLDGDGYPDFIVGSEFGIESPMHMSAGELRILWGRRRDQWPKWTNVLHESDVVIVGLNYSNGGLHQFTVAYSLVTGNFNGDGYEDVFMGGGYADQGRGAVYGLLGRPRGQWPTFVDLRTDPVDVTIWGNQRDGEGTGVYGWDLLGYAAALGDLDGDGVDDYVVSAPFADGPQDTCGGCGEVYVFYGSRDSVSVASVGAPGGSVRLRGAMPNPFNPSTRVRFEVPAGAAVDLRIFDVRGREVAHPLEGAVLACGECAYTWNAGGLPSGVYFVRLAAAGQVATGKITLLR